jgi:hypothetical protein
MLWPCAVIWERYEEYTAYPDYRDPRDRIWGIPNYVGGYEEWLVRRQVLERERIASQISEIAEEFPAEGETVPNNSRIRGDDPLTQSTVVGLRAPPCTRRSWERGERAIRPSHLSVFGPALRQWPTKLHASK